MAELLVAPDVVELVRGLLRTGLADIDERFAVPVQRSVPNPRPTTFVTVRLLGGRGRDRDLRVVDRVSVAVECWAAKTADAHDLAQHARAVVHAAQATTVAGTVTYRVEDAGAPVDLPDPLSSQSRFTFTVQLTVRLVRL